MTKNKKKSSLKKLKRGLFQNLTAKTEALALHYFPFVKSITPQILIILGCCLYVCLGLFCAAILGVLSINQENTPWPVCCYAFAYFTGLAGLLAAEHRSGKNLHFITYILLTTPINLAIVLFFNPQALFNFFGKLFPQSLLLTACALVFYVADYEPNTHKKPKNKKG